MKSRNMINSERWMIRGRETGSIYKERATYCRVVLVIDLSQEPTYLEIGQQSQLPIFPYLFQDLEHALCRISSYVNCSGGQLYLPRRHPVLVPYTRRHPTLLDIVDDLNLINTLLCMSVNFELPNVYLFTLYLVIWLPI